MSTATPFRIVQGEYAFECTRCGECCFDQDVFLEPLDAFLLGYPSLQFVNEDGWRARLPFVAWPGRGKKCPHLQFPIGCALHGTERKPFVCTFSPLARKRGDDHYYLVPPVDGCPGMGQSTPNKIIDTPRLQWSRWYQDNVAPHIEKNETLFRRAFSPQPTVARLNYLISDICPSAPIPPPYGDTDPTQLHHGRR